MSKVRVLLVDDHQTVREGLKALMNAEPDMEVVGETSDGRTLVEDANRLVPEIVVMDVSMPEVNGLAATRQLRTQLPNVKIVALTRHSEQAYLQQMMRAGAAGYVLKQSRAAELLHAIRAVAAGGTFLDPAMATHVVADYAGRRAEHPPGGTASRSLTAREEEVLKLVAWGYSNKEISAHLELSVKTVETHKTNAMRKLGMHNRSDVVRFALLKGWLQEE